LTWVNTCIVLLNSVLNWYGRFWYRLVWFDLV